MPESEAGRLPTETAKVGTRKRCYIRNCPWKHLAHILYCCRSPGDWVCESKVCWENGLKAKGFELAILSAKDYNDFIEAAILEKTDVIMRIIEKYKDVDIKKAMLV